MTKSVALLFLVGSVAFARAALTPTNIGEQLKKNMVGRELTEKESKEVLESIQSKAREVHLKAEEHVNTLARNTTFQESRVRRSPTATTCSACVGDGDFWNGVACVSSPSFVTAFFLFGCFWGNEYNYESDCNRACKIAFTESIQDAPIGAETLGVKTIAFHMPSTVGRDLGVADKPLYFTLYYYPEVTLNTMLLSFAIEMQSAHFDQGAQNDQLDKPPAAYFALDYIKISAGGFARLQSSGGNVQALSSIVMPEALYTYDITTCTSGVTSSSGSCPAETTLDQNNVVTLLKSKFLPVLTSFSAGNPLSSEKIMKLTMSANPNTGLVSTLRYHISLLNASLPNLGDYATLLGRPSAGANYTCGSTTEFLGVFDLKVDIEATGLTFSDSNQRLGLRLLTLAQGGTISLPDGVESETTDDSLLATGIVELKFSKSYLYSGSGAATCGDTRTATTAVKTASTQLDVTTGGTTCGYSAWYDADIKRELRAESPPISFLTCAFVNFNGATQATNILYDPELSTNTEKAGQLYDQTYPSSDGAATLASFTSFAIGLVAAASVFCLV